METKKTTTSVALKWGIISGFAGIVLGTIINMTDLWQSTGVQFIGLLLMAVFIFLAQKEFRTANEEFMSYGEGLGIGTMLSAISGVLAGIYNFIYTNYIDPTYMERVMAFQEEKFIEQGMSDAQIEAAIEMSSKFSGGGFSFLFAVLGSILIGFLISLIISAINVRKRPVF